MTRAQITAILASMPASELFAIRVTERRAIVHLSGPIVTSHNFNSVTDLVTIDYANGQKEFWPYDDIKAILTKPDVDALPYNIWEDVNPRYPR